MIRPDRAARPPYAGPVRVPEPAGNAIILAIGIALLVLFGLGCAGSVLVAAMIGISL